MVAAVAVLLRETVGDSWLSVTVAGVVWSLSESCALLECECF